MDVPSHIRDLVDHSLDAAAVVDETLRLLHFNFRYAELIGVAPRELRASEHRGLCHEALGLTSCLSGGCLARRALAANKHLRLDELRAELRDLTLIVGATPLTVGEGEPRLVVETFRDVTAESRMQAKYLAMLRQARENSRALQDELSATRAQLAELDKLTGLVAKSEGMQRVLAQVRRVALTDSTVMLTGETGVGKDAVAREIHRLSERANEKFLAVNCGALPETLLETELFGHERGAFTGATARRAGMFELADGGTLFLDEIGETSLGLQVKLLRVLEERVFLRVGGNVPVKSNVRIITATNRDLEAMVAEKTFRADLFYRLYVVPVCIPPLRERLADIPDLLLVALQRCGKGEVTLSRSAVDEALAYRWPGNVRELLHSVERAAALCNDRRIDTLDLSVSVGSFGAPAVPPSASKPLKEYVAGIVANAERRYLCDLLQRTGGALGDAAEQAGIDRKSLYNKMKAYGLSRDDFKPERPGAS